MTYQLWMAVPAEEFPCELGGKVFAFFHIMLLSNYHCPFVVARNTWAMKTKNEQRTSFILNGDLLLDSPMPL
jgi:hypothetical protein